MFNPDKTQSHSSKPSAPATRRLNLQFNLLPFRYRQPEAEMCFTAVPLDDLFPFKPAEVPEELTSPAPEGQVPDRFYTSGLPFGPGISVKVNLNDHPSLARLWCMQCIRRLLGPAVDYSRNKGPYTTQFWCSTERMTGEEPVSGAPEDETSEMRTFHRFTIKVLHRSSRSHPELLIGCKGTDRILNTGLEELLNRNPDTRILRRVAFRGKIYRWEQLPEAAFYHYNEVLPVLNKRVARWLLPAPNSCCTDNTSVCAFAMLSAFLKKHLFTSAFKAVADFDDHFRKAGPAETGSVPLAGGMLLFGEGGMSGNPVEGIAAHGPLKLPPGKHFSCFTVCFEEDEHLARKLFDCIVSNDPSRRLGSFIRVPMRFSHDHSIFLSSSGNAEQQLEHRLRETVFDPAITWCAFFICPPAGRLPKPDIKGLHARTTELLLQRGVLVQKVPATRLEGDLLEYSRLPGLDVLTRLGGQTWKPEGNALTDPVIGFAVNAGTNLQVPDVGAAAFFAPGGAFAGADVFNPANEHEWGGLSLAFFRKWQQENPPARRLVLHLPRPLNRRERTALQTMTDEGMPGVQVILMAVGRCRNRDIRALNSNDPDAGIPAGTWVRCSNKSYLLCTGNSRNGSINGTAGTVLLTIRFRLLNAGTDSIGQLAPGLLNQLYCLTRMHQPPSAHPGLPVTLTYPALLARLIPKFRSKALPEYGKRVPWFV